MITLKEKEFIDEWISYFSDKIKKFPTDFFNFQNYHSLELPGKPLVLGSEMFGTFEIIDTDGEVHFNIDDYNKVKYILYSGISQNKSVDVPDSNDEIRNVVKEYEKYIDSILIKIQTEYEGLFPDANNNTQVINKIFNSLNIKRY